MAEPIFPESEFRARLARLQGEMAKAGLDALLLTTAADIFYVTGFLTRFWESPARPWFLLAPGSGDPVAVIPSIGEHLMSQTWISDIRTWDAPNPCDDGVSLLSATIDELLGKAAVIGAPMGLETHLRMPLCDYLQVTKTIAPRRFADGTVVVQRTREVKSEAEIAKIRTICDIAHQTFEDISEIARAGHSMDAVFRDFQASLLGHGADWVSYVAGAASPGGYDDVISPATAAPLALGDVLMLDTGAVKDGYFCDFDRNFFVGPPSDAVRRTQAALWDATDDALSALRPGMRAFDAHRILSKGLEKRDVIPCGGRMGHGLGVTLTEWPSFTPLDNTELREGMVLTLEPSAFVEGKRFLVHEENIVLRADGPELLTQRAPREARII
ncbi:MAG: Xaa-Pro peptidase family protein [Paracoccaceae bacterium]|nr:Xaa-Pro peptidase family protein [Paracoccaceae bacterium]